MGTGDRPAELQPRGPRPSNRRRGRRSLVLIGLAALLAVLAFVLVYFQPQKLFIDDHVDEAFPADTSGALRAERRGTFASREHATSGTVTVYRLDDGRRVLRLEDLETSNGPALFVYLSANPADGPQAAFDAFYVDLGRLKGNIGSQNYEIPHTVDLGEIASVVIWCDRFDVAFGAAGLD
jgi:hypothetical protein